MSGLLENLPVNATECVNLENEPQWSLLMRGYRRHGSGNVGGDDPGPLRIEVTVEVLRSIMKATVFGSKSVVDLS